MSPPPGTARLLRTVRPLTPDLLSLQVKTEAVHNAAAKVQNVNQTNNYKAIATIKEEACDLIQTGRDTVKLAGIDANAALEAIDQALPEAAKVHIRQLKERLDQVEQMLYSVHGKQDAIAGKVQDGLDLEELDVERELQRGHELGVRTNQILEWRRVEKPYRPGPDGVA